MTTAGNPQVRPHFLTRPESLGRGQGASRARTCGQRRLTAGIRGQHGGPLRSTPVGLRTFRRWWGTDRSRWDPNLGSWPNVEAFELLSRRLAAGPGPALEWNERTPYRLVLSALSHADAPRRLAELRRRAADLCEWDDVAEMVLRLLIDRLEVELDRIRALLAAVSSPVLVDGPEGQVWPRIARETPRAPPAVRLTTDSLTAAPLAPPRPVPVRTGVPRVARTHRRGEPPTT